MAKPRVLVTRAFPDAGLSELAGACELDIWQEYLPPSREALMRRAPGIDGIISMVTDRIDGPLMDAAPHLRVISNYAVGFDNVDVPAATERGIVVGNTPGVLAEATADLAFALLLATARRLQNGVDFIRAGKWQTWHPLDLLGRDVHGASLGIIGLGVIGCEMAKRAHGFGMRVLYNNPTRHADRQSEHGVEYRELDDLLRESDFVSLHTPLNADTRHLINRRTLSLMKPTAILINAARGGVVDTDALYEALKEGRIWAAGLDVTDPEPLPANHKLLSLENCLIVPHMGSASVASRDGMAIVAARNLLAGLDGGRLPFSPNQDEVKARRRG